MRNSVVVPGGRFPPGAAPEEELILSGNKYLRLSKQIPLENPRPPNGSPKGSKGRIVDEAPISDYRGVHDCKERIVRHNNNNVSTAVGADKVADAF